MIIYDSLYGNTEQIAQAIGQGIGADEVKVQKIGEADIAAVAACDLLIIGSPTQGGRQTAAVKDFLDKIPPEVLKNKKAAAFDTRMKAFWVKVFGWAVDRIAQALRERGADLVALAEGFFVKSTKGPLVDGEAKRAAVWAKKIGINPE